MTLHNTETYTMRDTYCECCSARLSPGDVDENIEAGHRSDRARCADCWPCEAPCDPDGARARRRRKNAAARARHSVMRDLGMRRARNGAWE